MDAILLLLLNKKYHPLTFGLYSIGVGVRQHWTKCFSMIMLVYVIHSECLAQRSCTDWRLVLVLAIAVMLISTQQTLRCKNTCFCVLCLVNCCVVFCRSLVISLFLFFWPLYGLSFDLRLLITPLVSSYFSHSRQSHNMIISGSDAFFYSQII
jgi:hypothetical protein